MTIKSKRTVILLRIALSEWMLDIYVYCVIMIMLIGYVTQINNNALLLGSTFNVSYKHQEKGILYFKGLKSMTHKHLHDFFGNAIYNIGKILGDEKASLQKYPNLEALSGYLKLRWFRSHNRTKIQIVARKSHHYIIGQYSIGGYDPFILHLPDNFNSMDTCKIAQSYLPNIIIERCNNCNALENLSKVKRWLLCPSCSRQLKSTDKAGFVYIFGNKEYNLYKIGCSRNSPDKRMRDYQRSKLPFAVEMLGYGLCDDYREKERLLHQKLKSFKTNGEWFSLSDDVFTEIHSLIT